MVELAPEWLTQELCGSYNYNGSYRLNKLSNS